MTVSVSDRLMRRPGRGPHHRIGRAMHLTACGKVIQPDWERMTDITWADEDRCRRCFPPAAAPTATEALREAVIALRESREYIRGEAPHAPTDTEITRVLRLCQDALDRP